MNLTRGGVDLDSSAERLRLIQHSFIIDHDDNFISVGVTWNDGDVTTESFEECEDYDTAVYHFHDNGRWWQIGQNYYKFKRLLEDK